MQYTHLGRTGLQVSRLATSTPMYAGSPYLKPMIGARARAATVRVLPRG
jgi:hypothetical protein